MSTALDRRQFVRAAVTAPMILLGRVRLFGAEYSTRCVDVMHSSTVIDMLSPISLSSVRMNRLMSKPDSFTAADLANYRASGIHAFHASIGIGGPQAYENSLQYVAGWDSFLAHHSETLKRIDSVADIDAARASGKVGFIIGLQNS